MLISGGLAGLMAINNVMGEAERLLGNSASGAGFIGIAVALMGRNHPIGVVLAALLFGFLFQGGAELGLWTKIPIEMRIVVQGLVILFTGALDMMVRMLLDPDLRPVPPSQDWRPRDGLHTPFCKSLTAPCGWQRRLLLACLAGLYSERVRHLRHRAGRQDAGGRDVRGRGGGALRVGLDRAAWRASAGRWSLPPSTVSPPSPFAATS